MQLTLTLTLTSKLTTLLGASALLIIIAYSMAAGLYYLFLVGVAEFYNGHIRTAEALSALAGIGYWVVSIGMPIIFALLVLDKWAWIRSPSFHPLPGPADYPNPSPTPGQPRPPRPDTAIPNPSAQLRISNHTLRLSYPLWHPAFAWFQMITAIGFLTFFAVFHEEVLNPSLFSKENAELLNTPWLRSLVTWVSTWCSPLHTWILLSLSALSLVKGAADTFIRQLRTHPRPPQNPPPRA